jgi:hypothetical protein
MTQTLLDQYNNKLRKGFYWDNQFHEIMYFTGDYEKESAVFESRDHPKLYIHPNRTVTLTPILDPSDFLKTLTDDISWAGIKFGSLEQTTQQD